MAETRDRRGLWRSPVSLSASEQRAWAREVAVHAHAGQRDKAGEPFIRHCQRVADAVDGDEAKTVAFLHDVLEKSPGWTSERLLDCGFSPDIVAAVETLTHRPGETKDALVIRATSHPLAIAVKRADLEDNLAQLERHGRNGAQYRRRLHLFEVAIAQRHLDEEPQEAHPTATGAARAVRSQNGDRVAKSILVLMVALAAIAVAVTILTR